jgi:hypothetical protein
VSVRHLLQKLLFLLTLLSLMGGLISCAEEAETGPRAWIDFPRDRSNAPVGTPVAVISHAYAREGVAEVLLSVNGEAYRRDPPLEPGASFSEVKQEWLPQEEGVYTLQVRTYDTSGEVSNPDTVTVKVVGQQDPTPTSTATGTVEPTDTLTPDDTPTATATWTGTPLPTGTATPTIGPSDTPLPTDTPTPTITPTQLPTATPTPTNTFTPIPPAEVNFRVERDNITAGECTTLHWDVEHATAVYLNGAGVVGHGTQQVCPTNTTTYNLRVEAPSGNVDRNVTVNVSAPVDTTPPPVPSPAVPADGLTLTCRSSQSLVWMPVNDDSGISGYYVKLERQVTPGEWQSVRGWGPVSGKQVEADVQCGLFYRWAVRAQDGAGNYSDWSAWSQFSVGLD